MNNTITSMYGQPDEEPKTDEGKVNESTAVDFQIKTHARNFARIKIGKEDVTVPKAFYVKELENKVERLASDLKKTEAANRQLKSTVAGFQKDIADLRKELKGKMDRF
jgi:predicted  nucleic acid-binding Zn-ribbon protein